MFGRSLVALLLLSLASCQTTAEAPTPRLAVRDVAVFDGHSDVAIHYYQANPRWSFDSLDISRGLPGQADLPRWRGGGIYGALITVASDLPLGATGHFPRLLASLDWFDELTTRHSDDLIAVRTLAELREARRSGRIGLIPAIEGGEQIDGSLENLRTAYGRGVRSLLIVYDHHNDLGDGAMTLEQSRPIARKSHGGLSPVGRSLVAEMNRLGVIVDLSHAAETTVHDVLSVTRAPIIFSHSAARALADTPRNVSDETLRRVRGNGGVVMVPLVPYLTTTRHWRWWASGEAHYSSLVAAHAGDEAAVRRGMESWDRLNPEPEVTVADVADQVEHIARVAGYGHVGIGSDFDGMGRYAVKGIEHAGKMQFLLSELRQRGWTRQQLHALANGNFERVLGEVEATAKQLRQERVVG